MTLDVWTLKEMFKIIILIEICNDLGTCAPEVNKLLIIAETLNSAYPIRCIKMFAKKVRHRTLYSTCQAEAVTITHFLASLRAQDKFCSFKVDYLKARKAAVSKSPTRVK